MAGLAFGDLGSTETEPTMLPLSSEPPIAMLSKVLKRRGATLALNGLDLAIQPGQCVALLGPNGAGVEHVAHVFPETLSIDDAGRPFIDRQALGRIVFNDAAKKKELEDLLHPLVRAVTLAKSDATPLPPPVRADSDSALSPSEPPMRRLG
jgi:hypothetical protein